MMFVMGILSATLLISCIRVRMNVAKTDFADVTGINKSDDAAATFRSALITDKAMP